MYLDVDASDPEDDAPFVAVDGKISKSKG